MPDWPAAILFDFDGVIVNSEPVHFAAFVQLFADEGIAMSEREYYAELIGFDDRGAIGHLLQKNRHRADDAEIERLKARKLQLMHALLTRGDVLALPGVADFVRNFAASYPLAVCSGTVRPEIEIMLNGIGLREFFKIIVAADDVKVGKPDPMGYLLTARRIGEILGRTLLPADCLIIEDAPIVVESARRAGFPVLAVTTSYPADAVEDANWIVDSLQPAEVKQKIPSLRLAV